MVLLKTLRADKDSEGEETSGWKLVAGEVFRTPKYPVLLSALVGTGAQMILTAIISLSFAFVGLLSPANPGGLITALIITFVSTGGIAGFVSTMIYRVATWGYSSGSWKRNSLATGLIFPSIVLLMFLIMDLFQWYYGSSAAVPIGTFLTLVALVLFISLPSVFAGAYFGYIREIQITTDINTIPRYIPRESWHSSSAFTIFISGILPFSVIFVEQFFVINAIWKQEIYVVFGFLLLSFVLFIIVSAELNISLCYLQLNSENYAWWWRSFFAGGSVALYMYGYWIIYFFINLDVYGYIPVFIYFGYSILMGFMFFVLSGSIGFIACFLFVRATYSQLKSS